MAYGSSSGGGSGSGDGYVQGKSTFKGFSSRADQNNFKLYDFLNITKVHVIKEGVLRTYDKSMLRKIQKQGYNVI